jgi:hypothetical protein
VQNLLFQATLGGGGIFEIFKGGKGTLISQIQKKLFTRHFTYSSIHTTFLEEVFSESAQFGR